MGSACSFEAGANAAAPSRDVKRAQFKKTAADLKQRTGERLPEPSPTLTKDNTTEQQAQPSPQNRLPPLKHSKSEDSLLQVGKKKHIFEINERKDREDDTGPKSGLEELGKRVVCTLQGNCDEGSSEFKSSKGEFVHQAGSMGQRRRASITQLDGGSRDRRKGSIFEGGPGAPIPPKRELKRTESGLSNGPSSGSGFTAVPNSEQSGELTRPEKKRAGHTNMNKLVKRMDMVEL